MYLHRQGKLKPQHVLISLVSVLLLAIPLLGSVYPQPSGVYAWLPYVFLGLVGLGLLWFLALKLLAPQRLNDIEAVLQHE